MLLPPSHTLARLHQLHFSWELTLPTPILGAGLAARFVPCDLIPMDEFSKLGHRDALSRDMELSLGDCRLILPHLYSPKPDNGGKPTFAMRTEHGKCF